MGRIQLTVFEYLIIGTQFSQSWSSTNESIASDAHRAHNTRLDFTQFTSFHLSDTHSFSAAERRSCRTMSGNQKHTSHAFLSSSRQTQLSRSHDIHEGYKPRDLGPFHFVRSSCCSMDVHGHCRRISASCRRSYWLEGFRLTTDDKRQV